jgi:hypothetical protein
VVTEAATNLVKHARGGEIVLGASRENGGSAVRVLALDQGPGMGSVSDCFRDGYSSSGSLGGGLGAIRRTSSEFDIYSGPGGTILYSLIAPEAPGRNGIRWASICAPRPGELACGDGVSIERRGATATIVVADGLGHGEGAAEAAGLALASFQAHPDDSPTVALVRMQGSLRPTRGAAVAVAHVDLPRRTVVFAGIGNVSGVVLAEGEAPRHMISGHGIVGQHARPPRAFEYPLPERFTLVLHTDGIGTRWNLESYPGLLRRHPMLAAGAVFRDFRRASDDATVVVLREAA